MVPQRTSSELVTQMARKAHAATTGGASPACRPKKVARLPATTLAMTGRTRTCPIHVGEANRGD